MKINETDIAYLIVLGIFCFKVHNQVLYTADTEIEGLFFHVTLTPNRPSVSYNSNRMSILMSQILTRPGYKAKQIWLPSHNMASDFTDGSARNTNIDKERIESKGDEFNCQGSSFQ